MLEELKQTLCSFWTAHCAGRGGLLLGMLLGIAILVFGFWNTAFVLFCGGIGHYVATKMEKDEEWLEKMLSSLQNRLPSRFQNWF